MKINIPVLTSLVVFAFCSAANASTFGARLCANDSRFTCYTVRSGDSWQRLFSNPEERDLVMRLNRMNTRLYGGMRIAIPRNLSDTNRMDYSPLRTQIEPPGRKIILVSLNENQLAFGAYSASGVLQYWGPVSGGQAYCPDIGRGCRTRPGTYAVSDSNKGGAGCKSTKFPVGRGGAPMPYCMYFHGGYALHGSYEVPGYDASHGCVRMFVNDAQWLNQDFISGAGSVPVVISYSRI